MREILFRGKRIDNGEWRYGDLRQYSKNHIGIYSFELQQIVRGIDPSTVGQYTGLKDKNGKRIFEGDICQNDKTGGIVFVAWHGTMAGFVWSKKKWCDNLFDFGELFRVHDKYAVIGNIHDNPELLEVR